MRSLLLALGLLLAAPVQAQEQSSAKGRYMEAGDVSFDVYRYWHLLDSAFTYLPEPEYYWYGVAANFDLIFVERGPFKFHWDNTVLGASSQYQYRYVAWEYNLEASYKSVGLFWQHRSEHAIDFDVKQPYPLHDRLGLRLYFRH